MMLSSANKATTPGRRSGRTSRGGPLSSGRRSRNGSKKNRDRSKAPSMHRVRSWVQVNRALGNAGLVLPQWVPLLSLTVEEQEVRRIDLEAIRKAQSVANTAAVITEAATEAATEAEAALTAVDLTASAEVALDHMKKITTEGATTTTTTKSSETEAATEAALTAVDLTASAEVALDHMNKITTEGATTTTTTKASETSTAPFETNAAVAPMATDISTVTTRTITTLAPSDARTTAPTVTIMTAPSISTACTLEATFVATQASEKGIGVDGSSVLPTGEGDTTDSGGEPPLKRTRVDPQQADSTATAENEATSQVLTTTIDATMTLS